MKRKNYKTKRRAGSIIAILAAVILLLGLIGVLFQCTRQSELEPTPSPAPEHVEEIEFETDDDLIFGG